MQICIVGKVTDKTPRRDVIRTAEDFTTRNVIA